MSGRTSTVAVTGLAVVVLLALLAIAAPLVLPGSPTEITSAAALRAPTVVEPFGMDDLGRSVLSRVIHGYRVSLGVALVSVAMAVLLGLPLGLLAGYAEGVLDQLIMRPLDILMAFPAILLAIALTSVFGTGVLLVSLALAIVYVPIVARVVRAAVLATKAEVYVEGARAVGATARRLVLRHIVPNCVTPLLVQASVLMAIAILVEAALSFLGLGIQPPESSIGKLIADGQANGLNTWWLVTFPGLVITAIALCVNFVGDGLRDALDPTQRVRA
jgi:peptide/nickel transport system permease protein